MACGMGGGRRAEGNDTQVHQHQADAPHPEPDRHPKDPVNGELIVNPETAPNSTFQGRVYYFASQENRDIFEASPAQYAARVGEPTEDHRHHHRHGC